MKVVFTGQQPKWFRDESRMTNFGVLNTDMAFAKPYRTRFVRCRGVLKGF